MDDFYDDMLEGFDPYLIDLEEVEDLKVADLGIFHCVIWHSNCRPDFVSGSAHNDALRGYIQLGGKVFFSVYYPVGGLSRVTAIRLPSKPDGSSTMCWELGG